MTKRIIVALVLLTACTNSDDRARQILGTTQGCLRAAGKYTDITWCFLPDKSLLICTDEGCITNATEVPTVDPTSH